MALPVHRIFIHHEGAGAPKDNKVLAPYTIVIGVQEWHFDGTPETDWATKHFNHVSLGVCFTGNRNGPDDADPRGYPITDHDLEMLESAIHQARYLGYVAADAIILPHYLAPGLDTHTVCPGSRTMDRWADVYAAVRRGLGFVPPVEDKVKPAMNLTITRPIVDEFHSSEGSWLLLDDGGVVTLAGTFHGTVYGKPYFAGRKPARIDANPKHTKGDNRPPYIIVATSGETYGHDGF